MEINYQKVYQEISSIEFIKIEYLSDPNNAVKSDKRTHAINALLITEDKYLERITELLKDIFRLIDKRLKKQFPRKSPSKEEVAQLYCYFPSIYKLHCRLNKELKAGMTSTQQIGKILFKFLSQRELLEVYENYIEKYSEIESICREIKSKAEDKCFENLEQIILSPIQKFPQLSMAIRDIYKYTPMDSKDYLNIFKSLSIIKSIAARLDNKRRHYEYRNFCDLEKSLIKLNLNFQSTKILSTHSVNLLKKEFQKVEKVHKIPYYLKLCNQDIILVPKHKRPEELSNKNVFTYPINDVNLEQEVISRFISISSDLDLNENTENFNNYSIGFGDIEKIKDICLIIKGSAMDETLLYKYKELLQDQDLLEKAKSCLIRINKYERVVKISMDETFLELKNRRKIYEDELNLYFNLMISFSDKRFRSLCNRQIVLFDSLKILNDWKINFNRARLLSCIQIESDWFYYSAHKNFQEQDNLHLPLLFQPFQIKSSKVLTEQLEFVKYQIVSIVVSSVISQSLWICLPKGRMTIIHFDYKQWSILKSFNTRITDPVIDTCTFQEKDSNNNEIIDSEIWIAARNQVFIFSLIYNDNSLPKEQLNFESEITSLCCIENNIFVALKSTITIFSKDESMTWIKKNIFSLESVLLLNEKIKKIQYGNKLIYIVCECKIIVYEYNRNEFYQKKVFDSNNKINVISITPDGVWVSCNAEKTIDLYDNFFNSILFKVSVPQQMSSLPPTGNITSLYTNDRYIWIGTDTGCIICVSTVDSSYVVDRNVPMYFCSKFSSQAITEIMAFENIKSMPFKNQKREVFDQYTSVEESPNNSDHIDLNVTTFQYLAEDEVDCVTDRSLKNIYRNWKDCCLTFILAFGTGKLNEEYLEKEKTCDNLPTIFTFFE